jgi:hypothetical protein
MSVKVTGQVWALDIPSHEKLVLLAYADHASHDGTGIWPAVLLIARKTGHSERSVQQITRSLKRRGLLVEDGKGPKGTNKWRVGGAVLAPAESAPVQNQAQGGAETRTRGVQPTAPEPSLTVNEPSSRAHPSEVDYEQAAAKVDAMVENARRDTYANRDKIPEPYLPLADAYHNLTGQEPTKRVLHDWLQTFSEWQSEGIQSKHVQQAFKESTGRFVVARPGSLTNTAAAFKAKARLTSERAAEEERASQLESEIREQKIARAVPMPDDVRRRLDAFLKSKSSERRRDALSNL